MTKPITEDSDARTFSRNKYKVGQLYRRPAVPEGGVSPLIHIKLFGDDQNVTAGDDRFIFHIPVDMNNTNLVAAELYVTTPSSTGAVRVQVRIVDTDTDVINPYIFIDANELNSNTASSGWTFLETIAGTVQQNDQVALDVLQAGSGAMGLGIWLTYEALQAESST